MDKKKIVIPTAIRKTKLTEKSKSRATRELEKQNKELLQLIHSLFN